MNKLKLYLGGLEVLLVSNKADQRRGAQPILNRVALPLKIQVCSLGALLDSALKLATKVSEVAWSQWQSCMLRHRGRRAGKGMAGVYPGGVMRILEVWHTTLWGGAHDTVA